MVDNLSRNAELVVDARSRGRFQGTDPEPRPGLRSGHIPSSFSMPFTEFLESHTAPDGTTYSTLRSVDGLRDALIAAVGEQRAKDIMKGHASVITTCGSGMSAGVLWLGLKQLGVGNISLYDESWTGYAIRESSIVATGDT